MRTFWNWEVWLVLVRFLKVDIIVLWGGLNELNPQPRVDTKNSWLTAGQRFSQLVNRYQEGIKKWC